jgi:hypothetical protein
LWAKCGQGTRPRLWDTGNLPRSARPALDQSLLKGPAIGMQRPEAFSALGDRNSGCRGRILLHQYAYEIRCSALEFLHDHLQCLDKRCDVVVGHR